MKSKYHTPSSHSKICIDGTQPQTSHFSLNKGKQCNTIKFEEDFWKHNFAVVTCLSFVCPCLCLPASPGVVHLFPNLFQVAPPSVLPLHVHYSEEMFSALLNITRRKHYFLTVSTVHSFWLVYKFKLRREMVEKSLSRDNSVQIISGCLPPSLQYYTAAENLLLTPAKKTLYKRPDKYWWILSQPTYARRTSTQLFAQPCVSDTLVRSQESVQEKLV